MKKILLWGIGFIVVAGALLWGAVQLTAPTHISQADMETFARANQLYQNAQYATAAQLYQQVIANGGNNAEVYYNLGAALKAAGDAKGAQQAFAKANALAPRDTQIAQAAQISNGIFPPLTQNEIAIAALTAAMGVAFILLLVLERHWHKQPSAI